jgi:anti-anti-sigma factor
MDAEHGYFKIESRPGKRAGQRIIQISGRLVFDKTQRFTNFVRRENAPIVILDLSDLVDLDSTGVGMLVRTHASFKLQKQHLALVGINEKVRLVLEVTRVLGLLTVFETLAEAEEALALTADES